MDDKWGLFFTPDDGWDFRLIKTYPSFEEVEKALERISRNDPNPNHTYEIREEIDGFWETHFVVKWQFLVMTPKEAYSE